MAIKHDKDLTIESSRSCGNLNSRRLAFATCPGSLKLMRCYLALSLAALIPAAAAAAAPDMGEGIDNSSRYQQCIALSKIDGQGAYNQALAWHSAGGGSSAEHCGALALVQLGRYVEAAPRLDLLAQQIGVKPSLRAQLYDQAGNAWLLAEDGGRAEVSFSNALILTPRDVDVLADRARARAMRKNWAGADADLSAALAADADRTDLLVLRASARHAAGKKDEARADIARALAIFPNYGDALVERGAMKYEDGDVKGAYADWQQVVKLSPKSRAAALAGEYLSQTGAK
jgi:tetratricopeptide (TPR) repeat protein